ncbi:MAG TPA: sulfotransferase [Streptosporangiaceae bacterium]
MRNENGNGHGNGDPVRVTRPDDPAEGRLGADARSPGSLWMLPQGNGVRRISLSDDAQPPVFVLSVARSGSTLLRFILDSHPDLACPPETNVGQVCFGLARLWDLLDPSPESVKDGWQPAAVPGQLPPDAVMFIRAAVEQVYGRYLARQGKRRWCDKSLDSAGLAELLAHVYPGAQFICLYRHCMDVVVSAIEAAPWGLSGYGFDQYVAGSPGNMVLAAAHCWLDQTRAITEFQEKYPDRCHGIRYEDLVTGPEQIAGELFTFLGLAPVPGITGTCLSQEHDTRGPADHKIWFTSRISTASLGQGARAPVQMLPPEFLKNLNETLDQLGYRQVDEHWRAAPGPADPRADGAPDAAPGEPAAAALDADAAAGEIASRLGSVPEDRLRDLARRWPAIAGRNLVIAVQPANGSRRRHCWTVSCADSVLTVRQAENEGDATVTVLAPPATWQALLDGQANFAAEMRAGRLRLVTTPAGPHTGETVNLTAAMHLIAHLLGLAAGSQSPSEDQQETCCSPQDERAGQHRKAGK